MSVATEAFAPGTYTADPIHSNFGFAIKHLISTFRSTFSDVAATLTVGPDGALAIEGAAQVESIGITTPKEFRGHVLSAEFFDAEVHPAITFRSTDVTLHDDGTALVAGTLTVKDNAVDVVAHGTYAAPTTHFTGAQVGGFALTTTVNKNDLGLTWNAPLPKGGNVLAEDVTIAIEVEFVSDAAPEGA